MSQNLSIVIGMAQNYINRNNLTDYPTDIHDFLYLVYTVHQMRVGAKYAIAVIVLSIPLLLLQLTSLPIFVVYQKFWKNTFFRILFSYGCFDCIQLATICAFGFFNLFVKDLSTIQRFGGAIAFPAWYIVLFQHFFMAFNRLIVVMQAYINGASNKWLSDKKLEAMIINIALLLCWITYLALFLLFLSPYVGAVLNRGTMVFLFDHTRPYTKLFKNIIWPLTFLIPFLCFFIYGVIIWIMKKNRTDAQERKELLDVYERRLLIQAIILCSFSAYLMLSFTGIHRCDIQYAESICTAFIPFTEVSLFKIPLHWVTIFVQIPWIISCGLSPILLLVMNKEFRARYIQFYTTCKPCKQPQMTEISTAATTLANGDGEEKGNSIGIARK